MGMVLEQYDDQHSMKTQVHRVKKYYFEHKDLSTWMTSTLRNARQSDTSQQIVHKINPGRADALIHRTRHHEDAHNSQDGNQSDRIGYHVILHEMVTDIDT